MERARHTAARGRARDVNTALQDLVLKRAVLQQRWENAAVADLQGPLATLRANILALVAHSGLYPEVKRPRDAHGGAFGFVDPTRYERVKHLIGEVGLQVAHFLHGALGGMKKDLAALAQVELHTLPKDVQAVLDQHVQAATATQEAIDPDTGEEIPDTFAAYFGPGIRPALSPPEPLLLPPLFRAVPTTYITELLGTPLGGAFYATSFADLGARLVTGVRNVLLAGLVSGEGVPNLTRRLQAVMGNADYQAERIVRSEFGRVSNQANLATYAQNADLIQSVQWVATLDADTCLQCGELDGRTWESMAAAPIPVADTHPNCRCRLVPVVKDAESLGLPPGSRASFTGQVPDTLTYDEWFDQQDPSFQQDVLGPTRYNLYRSGRADLSDFANASGVHRIRDVLANLAESAGQCEVAFSEDLEGECIWRTIRGNPVCINPAHAEHRKPMAPPELATQLGLPGFQHSSVMAQSPIDQERQAFLDQARVDGVQAVDALWEKMKADGEDIEVSGSDWASLDDETKGEIQNQWENDHYEEEYDKAVEEWKSNERESVLQDVGANARELLDPDSVSGFVASAVDEHANENWRQALVDKIESGDISEDDLWNAFTNNLSLKELAEIGGIQNPEGISDDVEKRFAQYLSRRYDRAIEDQVDSIMEDREPPESLKDSVIEGLSDTFYSQDAETLDQLARDYGDSTRSVKAEEPDAWVLDPADGDQRDYKWTGAVGTALTLKRAEELWKERYPTAEMPSFEQRAERLWGSWKGDSYDPGALLLHAAVVNEFGANTRGEEVLRARRQGTVDPYDSPNLRETQVYTRALWDTTQFLMQKANLSELTVYRGVTMTGLDKTRTVTIDKGTDPYRDSYTKLPDLPLQQNAAQSTTLKPSVANNWSGITGSSPTDGERVVIRARVPSTAVLSLPVYGQNYHNEKEVVVLGTPWHQWDAWRKRAPEGSTVMFEALLKLIEARFRKRGGIITQDGLPPKPGEPVIDFGKVEQTGEGHWLKPRPGIQQEAVAKSDECLFRTINGHVVCIRGGHQRHGKDEPAPKPAAGGYHGTTEQALKSILKTGLLRSKSGGIFPGISDSDKVYITTSPDNAATWAYQAALKTAAAGQGPQALAMVEVDIPPSAASKLRLDSHFDYGEDDMPQRQFSGDIPPQWIKRAWISLPTDPENPKSVGYARSSPLAPNSSKFWKQVLGEAAETGSQTIYVAWLIPLSKGVQQEAADDCHWITYQGRRICITGGHAHAGESATVITTTEEAALSPKNRTKFEKLLATFHLTREGMHAEILSKISNADGTINAELLAEARHWYPDAHAFAQDLTGKANITLEQAIGAISALSPQNPWEYKTQYGTMGNKTDAVAVVKYFAEHETDAQTPAQLAAGLKALYNPKGNNADHHLGPSVLAPRDNVTKAFAILRDGSAANLAKQLGTLKTASFYNNILAPGQTRSVTVDGHMAKALAYAALAQGIRMPKEGPGPEGDTPGSVEAAMDPKVWGSMGHVLIADQVRKIADTLHESPDTIQAAYWLVVQPRNPFKEQDQYEQPWRPGAFGWRKQTVSEAQQESPQLLAVRTDMPWGDGLPLEPEEIAQRLGMRREDLLEAIPGACQWITKEGRHICITAGHGEHGPGEPKVQIEPQENETTIRVSTDHLHILASIPNAPDPDSVYIDFLYNATAELDPTVEPKPTTAPASRRELGQIIKTLVATVKQRWPSVQYITADVINPRLAKLMTKMGAAMKDVGGGVTMASMPLKLVTQEALEALEAAEAEILMEAPAALAADACTWITKGGRHICITSGHGSRHGEAPSTALGGQLPKTARYLVDQGWTAQSASPAAHGRHQSIVYTHPEYGTVTAFANGDWVFEPFDGRPPTQGHRLFSLKAHLLKVGLLESSTPFREMLGPHWDLAEADAECHWITKNGRPICITAGHGHEPVRFADSLGIERKAMPQIWARDMPEFLAYAAKKGVPITRELTTAADLHPAQAHYNPDQVAQLRPEMLAKPLVVSADHYVLDGTHRWVRLMQDEPDRQIQVIRIGLPATQAIALMHSFPKVGRSDISQIGGPTHLQPVLREADDECRWITKNGRRICITAGHERQHAKEEVRAAAAEIGGMKETTNPGGAFYKNIELDGGRIQRQITIRAAAPGQPPGFKVVVSQTFATSLGGNSLSNSFNFKTVEAAKRFVQHASASEDLRTFHEAADTCHWITYQGRKICIGDASHARHGDIEPKIYMRPGDLEKVTSWGGQEQWKDKNKGDLLKGPPLTKADLPETLYHVTVAAPAIEKMGMLVGQSDGGGMGGGAGRPGVSFTTSQADADLMRKELGREIDLAHRPNDMSGRITRGMLERYAREDEQQAGVPAGTFQRAVDYAMGNYEANVQPVTHAFDMEKYGGYSADVLKSDWERGLRSLGHDAHSAYMQARETDAIQALGADYMAFRVEPRYAPAKNPLIFGDAEAFLKLDKKNLGILEVPRAAIPDGALIRPGTDDFLHEIRVHADVPLKPKEPA